MDGELASFLRIEERELKAGGLNHPEEKRLLVPEPLSTREITWLAHLKGSGSALPVPKMSDACSSIHGRTRGNASAAATVPATTSRAFRMR